VAISIEANHVCGWSLQLGTKSTALGADSPSIPAGPNTSGRDRLTSGSQTADSSYRGSSRIIGRGLWKAVGSCRCKLIDPNAVQATVTIERVGALQDDAG